VASEMLKGPMLTFACWVGSTEISTQAAQPPEASGSGLLEMRT
jgi:hypothetical protein